MENQKKNRAKKIALTVVSVSAVFGVGCLYIKSRPLGSSVNHLNSHFSRVTGLPKIAYESEFGAKLMAVLDSFVYATKLVAYKCPICGKFHIGHPVAARKRSLFQSGSFL